MADSTGVTAGKAEAVEPKRPRRGQVVCLLVVPVLVIGASAGLGIWVIRAGDLLEDHWLRQMLVAAGVAVLSGLFGSGTLAVTWQCWPTYLPQGLLAGIAIRLMATLVIVLILALVVGGLSKVFFLAIGGFYIIGLISETVLAITMVRRAYSGENEYASASK